MLFSASTQSQLVANVDLSGGSYTVFMLIYMNSSTLSASSGQTFGNVLTQASAADVPFSLGFAGGIMDTAVVTSTTIISSTTPAVVPGQWILYELFVNAGASATLLKYVSACSAFS